MVEKKDIQTEPKKIKTSSLPSLKELVRDAWNLFKKTVGPYLRLIGFGIAYMVLVILIGILLALPVIFTAINSHLQVFTHLTPFSVISLILLGVWGIFYVTSIIFLSVVFPIASIFILDGKKGKVIELIKQSKKLFWPYFLTILLTGLFVLGGMGLLVIPGFLIAFFFTFVAFEVVIEKQSGVIALKRSYFMIKNYFWGVFGRVLLLEITVISMSAIFSSFARGDIILRLVQVVFSIFVAWYARAYLFILYKQVRERTTFPEKISINWIWIVAAIGWVIFTLLLIGVGYVISHLPPVQPHHPYRIPHGAA